METFSHSVYSSLSTANLSNKLELKVEKQDIDNIIFVYDLSHAINISHTLIQFLLTLVYIKPPYVLSNDLIEYTLNKVFEKCSSESIHFYDVLTSLIVSKRCRNWLEKNNNSIVDAFIANLLTSFAENKSAKTKIILAQLIFLVASALHLSKYMLQKHNLHIEIYNLVKSKQDFSVEIYNLSGRLIQRIIFNNPGSEKGFMEHMIKDLESLQKRKDVNFLKFYMDLLGIEEEVSITLRGLSSIPKQDFTIPSDLLSKDDQIAIVKQISEKSKYSLIVSIDQDCDNSKKSAVMNAISAPPFLVLAEFVDTQNHKILVGAYCSGNVNLNTNDNIY